MRERGFEIVSSYQNKGINLPKRQTLHSAGYDLESAETIVINPQEVKLIPTGLKAYMQPDEVLQIYVRSSIPLKRGVMMANNVGIIDSDYYNNEQNEGHIMIPMYNFSKNPVIINKGEKIAQGIFMKYLTVFDDAPVNRIRSGGFGSSSE